MLKRQIVYMNHKVKEEFIIKIGDKMIQRVFETKFLGVIIDDKLNWKEHIKYISAKSSKTIAIVFKSKLLIEYKTAIIMYKAKNLLLPKNIQKPFKSKKHPNYNTRQVEQFSVKRHRTSLKCMCISICGVK